MDTGSAPQNWLARHPFIVIGALLAAGLGPFLNQAVQTDDTLFVWTAQWIAHHPLDFFGFKVNWWGSSIPMWMANYNPPLLPYLLAAAGSVLGWHEIVLHSVGLAIAFAAAAGIYRLAQIWSPRPLLATVIALLTPAFLVLGTTLMCDVTMLACWVWALVCWERASTGEPSRWQYLAAGALAGLAVLAKYSALSLLPLLLLLALTHRRHWGWKLAGLLLPVAMIAGFECLTTRMYGHGLLALASHYARANRFGFPGGAPAKAIIGLAFAGGSFLPAFFLAPWLWRPKALLAGGLVLVTALAAAVWLPGNPGITHPWVDADGYLLKLWDFRLQAGLLALAGLHLLLLTGVSAWQGRDRISLILAGWVAAVLFFATVVNWTVNARSFLPAVPALAILLARRLATVRPAAARGVWLSLAAAALVALALAQANCQLANSARTAATQIAAKFSSADHQLWFDGHSGFQYYMEKLGGRPIDVEQSLLQPGDIVVAPMLGSFIMLPVRSVSPLVAMTVQVNSGMNLQGASARTAAGFYTADDGPLPFALGAPQAEEYFAAKVLFRVQYQSQPSDPQAVLRGALPSFPHPVYSTDDDRLRQQNAAATEPVQAARQLVMAGQEAAAVQEYERILKLQTNNPVAMSQLAWILATARQPALQDHRRAVQLAGAAVKLTDSREASMLVILATAYAADGQLANASFTAEMARNLALLTGQPEVAATALKLARACAAR